MQTERDYRQEIVVGEYRVLLRMEGELYLPIAYPAIRAFYQRLLENTLYWGKEIAGKSLCAEYAALGTPLEKSRFPTTRCTMFTELPYEDRKHAAIVAGARWSGKKEGLFYYAGVWNLAKEELLPPRQIKKLPDLAKALAAYGKNPYKTPCKAEPYML